MTADPVLDASERNGALRLLGVRLSRSRAIVARLAGHRSGLDCVGFRPACRTIMVKGRARKGQLFVVTERMTVALIQLKLDKPD